MHVPDTVLRAAALLLASCIGVAAGEADSLVVDDFERGTASAWSTAGPVRGTIEIVEDAHAGRYAGKLSFPECRAGKWASASLRFDSLAVTWSRLDAFCFWVKGRLDKGQQKLIVNEADRDRWWAPVPLRSDAWTQVTVRFDGSGLTSYRKFGDGKLDPLRIVRIEFVVEGDAPAHAFVLDDVMLQGRRRPAAKPDRAFSQFRERRGGYTAVRFPALYREFVRIDPQTRYPANAAGPLFVLSPVYVHLNREYVGYNAGGVFPIAPPSRREMQIDLDGLDSDCAHLRSLGFNCLNIRLMVRALIADGRWLATHDGRKGYQIYDELLDIVQKHGLYVVLPIWPSPPQTAPGSNVPWHDVVLDDALWQAYCEDVAKVVHYFSKRKVILGWTLGHETMVVPVARGRGIGADPATDDPRVRRLFQQWLSKRYGTVKRLQAAWRGGYVRTQNGHEYRAGAFEGLRSFVDVDVPPRIRRGKWLLNQQRDPVMVDFNFFREDLYIERTNVLSRAIRGADPNHIVLFDFAGEPFSWTNMWSGRRGADIECDLITFGGGYCHRRFMPFHKHPHTTSMEYTRVVAYNAPMVLKASDAHPAAIGCGEFGYACRYQGDTNSGLEIHRVKPGLPIVAQSEDEQLEWMSSLFTDYLGGGCGYVRVYDAGMIRLPRITGGPPQDHKICKWLQGVTAALRRTGDTFEIKNARVAILRNKATYFSAVSSMDPHNVYNFGNVLYQLHVPYDVLTEDTISAGPARFKVALDAYRAIFVPHQHQLLSQATWALLEDWLRTPGRVLCVGLYEPYDTHFNACEPWPAMARVTGVQGYSRVQRLAGEQALHLGPGFDASGRGAALPINLPVPARGREDETCPVGLFADSAGLDVVATLGRESVVVRHRLDNGNSVYSCGFPLGFRYLWRDSEPAKPMALNRLFGPMVSEAGVRPEFQAPANFGVHVSKAGRLVLFKERYGLAEPFEMRSSRLGDAVYSGVATIKEPDGTTILRATVTPRTAAWAERVAGLRSEAGKRVEATSAQADEQGVRVHLRGEGPVQLTLQGQPDRRYRVATEGRVSLQPPTTTARTDGSGAIELKATLAGEAAVTATRVE